MPFVHVAIGAEGGQVVLSGVEREGDASVGIGVFLGGP